MLDDRMSIAGSGGAGDYARQSARSVMRLKCSAASAKERLVNLQNEGYAVLKSIQTEYQQIEATRKFDDRVDTSNLAAQFDAWVDRVHQGLIDIFPTELEANKFMNPDRQFGSVGPDHYRFHCMLLHCQDSLRALDRIKTTSVDEYTDLPTSTRLFVEDIDSFQKVRDINPAAVADLLNDGYLDHSEDSVQMALEQILSVAMHKKDWGGETNDLYTANVIVNGSRRETAFLLKGHGLRKKKMEIRDCGANGDQLVRLVSSPAKIFVVQFVGNIAETLIKDIEGKIENLRSQGREAWFCIIDGQDTARVLRAYGKA